MEREMHPGGHCPACRRPVCGDGERCIFCSAGLQLAPVAAWRPVYHACSYADALLATSTLRSHGVVARLAGHGAERALMGCAHGVVQVADGQHLLAQEVLRQVRGVRTDTEYLEWRALKNRVRLRRGIVLAVLTALATAASVLALMHQPPESVPATTRGGR